MVDVRKHRGGFDESMQTVFQVASRRELLAAVRHDFPDSEISDTDIEIKPGKKDGRNGWDTHTVAVKGLGVYGYSNGPIKF
jgi:hypothetical protein